MSMPQAPRIRAVRLSTLGSADGRAIFTIGVFDSDLAVPESKQIAAISFHARAVRTGAGELPFRHAAIAADPMTSFAPSSVWERCPRQRKTAAHGFAAFVARPAFVEPGCRLEDAVVGHERHQGVDVVAIPCIGKRLQEFCGYLGHDWFSPSVA